MRSTSTFSHVAGGVLVVHGTLGFAITGLATVPEAQDRLLGIGISPLVNAIHVGIGLALITAAALSPASGRTATLVAAVALGTLGLLGLAGSASNGALTGTDGTTTAGHLVLAAWATVTTIRAAGQRCDPSEGRATTKAVQR